MGCWWRFSKGRYHTLNDDEELKVRTCLDEEMEAQICELPNSKIEMEAQNRDLANFKDEPYFKHD